MQENDILKDKDLEDLGLIKDIDTLSIIYEATEIKNRRRKIIINLLGIIGAFIIIFFNFTIPIIVGIKFFILIQLIISSLIAISFLPILKKKYN